MSLKLLVVSDSHGDYSTLKEIYYKHQECDYFFHLGDSCIPKYLINNFAAVRGNCDFTDLPLELNIDTQYGTIHLEHGHLLGLHLDEVLSKHYLMVLSGHTHVKDVKKLGSTWFFNPGSLTRPRDGDKGSYLIITINSEDDISYEFEYI